VTTLAIICLVAGSVWVTALALFVPRFEVTTMPEKTYDLEKLIELVAKGREMRALQTKHLKAKDRDLNEVWRLRASRAEVVFDALLDQLDPPAAARPLFRDEENPPRSGAYPEAGRGRS